MRCQPILGALLVFGAVLSAQAQSIDETYNQKIKEYTTDPRFLPSSVLNLINDPKFHRRSSSLGRLSERRARCTAPKRSTGTSAS